MKRSLALPLGAALGLAVFATSTLLPASARSRPAALAGFRLSPAQIRSGGTAKLKIVLNDLAPTGGLTITISDSNPKVLPLPKAITIPAGSRRLGLTITTGAVTTSTRVTLSGSYAGVTRREVVTVSP
jgi:hypothetical protein